MRKDSIKDLVKTQAIYEKGAKAVKKAGGLKAVRKKLIKKVK